MSFVHSELGREGGLYDPVSLHHRISLLHGICCQVGGNCVCLLVISVPYNCVVSVNIIFQSHLSFSGGNATQNLPG